VRRVSARCTTSSRTILDVLNLHGRMTPCALWQSTEFVAPEERGGGALKTLARLRPRRAAFGNRRSRDDPDFFDMHLMGTESNVKLVPEAELAVQPASHPKKSGEDLSAAAGSKLRHAGETTSRSATDRARRSPPPRRRQDAQMCHLEKCRFGPVADRR
jgi:hypothetical protein